MMYQGSASRAPRSSTTWPTSSRASWCHASTRLEERLKVVKGDKYLAERLDLKTYLMLNDAEHDFENLDVEWATGQYTSLWFELVKPIADKPEVDLKKQMAEHVRYYFTLLKLKRVTPVPLNKDLIAYVRKVLMNVPVAKRYYDLYVSSVAEEKIDDAGTTVAPTAGTPRSRCRTSLRSARCHEGADERHVREGQERGKRSRAHTERGHYAVLRNIASGIGLLQQDAWVIPLDPDETQDKIAATINTLANEYEKKYIQAWQDSWPT